MNNWLVRSISHCFSVGFFTIMDQSKKVLSLQAQSRLMSSLGRKVEIVTYIGIFKAFSKGPRMIDCKLLCCISFWLHLQLKMAATGVFEGEKPFVHGLLARTPPIQKIDLTLSKVAWFTD